MNGARRFVAVGNSLNKDARSKGDVAAGKDAGGRCHQILVDLEDSARRHLHALFAAEEREVGLLADGQDHAVAGDDLFFVTEYRIEAAVFIKNSETAADFESGDDAVLADNLFRSPTVIHHDALVLGFVNFALPCRHLCARFQADHVDFFGARAQSHARRVKGGLQALGIIVFGKVHSLMHEADGRARHINGYVTAAHHNHALPKFNLKSEIDVNEKIDAVVNACQVRSRNVQLAAFVEPGGEKDRIELRPQIAEGDVASQRHAGMQRDPYGQNVVDFHLDDFPRQPELRNAQIKHAARNRGRLKNFNRVTQQGQVMGACKATNAGAHNRNPLISLGSRRQLLAGRVVSGAQVVAIRCVALQCADGYRFVDLTAPTVVLAGMSTDAAQNVCERIRRAGQQVCFLVLSDPYGLPIAPAFGVNR